MIPICKVVSIHGLDQRLDQRTNMCMCFCRAPHSYVLFGQFTRFATCTHAEVRENTERCLKNVYILSRPIGSDNSDHEDKPMFSDNSNLPLCNGGYGVIHFVHKPSYQKPPAYQHATSYQKIPVNRLDQWTKHTHSIRRGACTEQGTKPVVSAYFNVGFAYDHCRCFLITLLSRCLMKGIEWYI